MTELRHMFGAMRRDEGEPLDGPPSLARVERLAQRARDAGLPVEVVVEGEPDALPPGVDLAAYRVVQEALTNAYKHAGPAHARVHIRYEPHELLLEVSDDGVGAGTAGDLGVTDAFDVAQNISGGAKYLAQLLKDFNGNTQLATAAYNAGEAAVQKYGGVPPYDETQVYVQRVEQLRDRYHKAL